MSLTKRDMRNLAVRFTLEYLSKTKPDWEVYVRGKIEDLGVNDTDTNTIMGMLPLIKLQLTNEKEMRYG